MHLAMFTKYSYILNTVFSLNRIYLVCYQIAGQQENAESGNNENGNGNGKEDDVVQYRAVASTSSSCNFPFTSVS